MSEMSDGTPDTSTEETTEVVVPEPQTDATPPEADETIPATTDDGESQPGEGEAAAPETDSSVDAVSPELVERAATYGLTEADLEGFGDKAPEVVEVYARSFARRLLAQAAEPVVEGEPPEPQTEQQPAPPEEPAAPPVAHSGLAKVFESLGYDEEAVAVAHAHDQANEALQAQVAELSRFRDSIQGREVAAQRSADKQAYGAWHSALPQEHQELLKQPQVASKMASIGQLLQRGYRAEYGKPFPMAELCSLTMNMAAAPELDKLAVSKVAGQMKDQASQQTTPPSGREPLTPTAPSTREEELRAVRDVMEDHGVRTPFDFRAVTAATQKPT